MNQTPHAGQPLSRLVLDGLTTLGDASQNLLTVLVELELVDDDLGGVDGDRDGLAVGLLTDDGRHVDGELETVHGRDLALAALVGALHDGDLVVLADGDGADLSGTASENGFYRSGSGHVERTLYFSRSSRLRGALRMVRRSEEGAWK